MKIKQLIYISEEIRKDFKDMTSFKEEAMSNVLERFMVQYIKDNFNERMEDLKRKELSKELLESYKGQPHMYIPNDNSEPVNKMPDDFFPKNIK